MGFKRYVMSMFRMRKSFPRRAERVPIGSERRRDAASAANALRRRDRAAGVENCQGIFLLLFLFFFRFLKLILDFICIFSVINSLISAT